MALFTIELILLSVVAQASAQAMPECLHALHSDLALGLSLLLEFLPADGHIWLEPWQLLAFYCIHRQGTISMIFDISFMLGVAADQQQVAGCSGRCSVGCSQRSYLRGRPQTTRTRLQT